jgi:sugar phosphate isomerase/epimerase
MRFGIETLQQDILAPAGIPADKVIAHIGSMEHAGLARQLYEHGFRLVELSGDLVLLLPHSFSPPTIDRLAALKAETRLSYTVHLPLWSVEPSTPLYPVREGSLRALIDVARATLPLQPESYVLHATGALAAEFYRMDLPDAARAFVLRQFQANARQSIDTLLSETGLESRRLAIETIEFPFDLTLELAEELDLSICLDTGHVLAGFSGPLDLFEVLEASLPRLGEIHLHDCPRPGPGQGPGYGLDHQRLGRGHLDTGRLLDRLATAGWDGPIILELPVEEALASLEVIRALRPNVQIPSS